MKKLTIGSAVYDDFEGVYFTYQSLRLNTQDIWDDLEFIIIDNNPTSAEGNATRHFCEQTKQIRYIPYTEKRGTSIRNEIFRNSKAKFCLIIDPHVLFEPGTIQTLLAFFHKNPKTNDLFHGPMLYDIVKNHDLSSKMNPVWRADMFGTWAADKRGNNKYNDPFEIEMQGLGVFACRTKAWLWFNKEFVGFGGEEGYIHKKFQKAGHKIWCLPFFRWIHRFQRPLGTKYPLAIEERVWNYLVGHDELGLPLSDVVEHFEEKHPYLNIQSLIDGLGKPFAPQSALKTDSKGGEEIILWEDSIINFNQKSPLRYIEFRILNSYDGRGSLRCISISPFPAEEVSIHHFSSECPTGPATAVLEDSDSFWLSDRSAKPPHSVVIDLGQPSPIEKIVSSTRKGIQPGLPTEFKVLGSNNLIEWHELSHQNILTQGAGS